jgi:hypothetical protein
VIAERIKLKPGRREILLVAAAFLLTRILAAALGVRFDVAPLDFYWQYVDPALLARDLWGSVLPLHSQPPLFNLFLGAVLRLPEGLRMPAFQAVYLTLGLTLVLALLGLLARLGVGPRLRTGLTLITVVSPVLVLYENLLSPALPIAAALTGSALFFHRFMAERRLGDGLVFGAFVAALVLTHSLFHLIWLIVALGLAALGLWRPRPTPAAARKTRLATALALLLPLLLGLAWYARSLALHGSFAASSWLGMSLANTAPRMMSPADRRSLLTGERAVLKIPPFSPLPAYAGLVPTPPATGRPVLDQPWKSTGAINLHHLAYRDVSRLYRDAWVSLVRLRPDLQARAVGAAWLVSFHSAADSSWFGDNRVRLGLWPDLGRWLSGQVEPFQGVLGGWYVAWLTLLGWAAGVAWGIWESVKALRTGRQDRSRPAALTVAYLTFTVLWVALVGNLVELGENDRFRLFAQPLATALLGGFLAKRRGQQNRHDQIAAFATAEAGTELDLDPEMEQAGLEAIRRPRIR